MSEKFFKVAYGDDWQNYGQCTNDLVAAEALFNDYRNSKKINEVKNRYCGRCVVVNECLEYALETNQDYGIWGKLTVQERKKLKKQQENVARGRSNSRRAS